MSTLVFVQVIVALATIDKGLEVGFFVMNILLVLYIFVVWAFVGLLLGFHLFLSANNTTTNEFCKDSWDKISGNPFSK
jgi:L-cystine uptake protein TcyP (sodium:dicarboxylate symporter family)